jgi:HicB family
MTRGTLPAQADAPKYLLRIPPALNDRLRRLADEQGLSLNTFLLLLLASSVGFEFESEDQMMDTDKSRALTWLNARVGHRVTRFQLERDDRGGERSVGLVQGRLMPVLDDRAHVIHGVGPRGEDAGMWVDPDATVSQEGGRLRIQLGTKAWLLEDNGHQPA